DTEMLAWVYEREGRPAEAAPIYKQILDSRSKTLGPNSHYLIWTLNHYSLALKKLNRQAEAEKVIARLHEICALTEKEGCVECLKPYKSVAAGSSKAATND